MPPPGWYPDPELAWTWRWWDGGRWTDLRAPQRVPPERDPYSFSAWFEESVAAVKAVVLRIGVPVLAAWMVVGFLALIGFVIVARSGTGREIRDLLEFDTSFGVAGSETTVELTDAEIDRLGELIGDVAWWALPWLAVVTLLAILVSAWVTALVARAAERAVAGDLEGGRARVEAVSRTDDAADALRRVPAVLASTIVFGLVIALGFLVVSIPLLLVLVLGLGGGAIALAAVFGFLAAFALGFYVWVRLSLAPVIAAVGGHGIGVRRSWTLTDGHVWPVAGRLVIVALVAGAISTPLSAVNAIAPFFGLMTYVVTLVVLQAATVAATSLTSVPAQIVLVRRLGERYAPRLGS
jgi:hypothetical protein